MGTIKLSNEAKLLNNLVQKIGCVTVSQAKEILTSTTPVKEKTADTIISILSTKQLIRVIDRKYLVPFHNGKVSKKAIECLWYVMDKLNTADQFDQIFNSNAPADLFYIDKNGISNELIHISDKNLGLVDAIIKKYIESTDREKTYSYNNIFLFDQSVNEDKILLSFSERNLTIPHSIVFLKYTDMCKKPEIIEYGNDKDNEEIAE